MEKIIYLFVALFLVSVSFSQKELKSSGLFSLGGRSTISLFNDHKDESIGRGLGGQFRIQLSDRVNTEWFADYFNSSIGNYASRTDYHIGWSVMFYLLEKEKRNKFNPYILAGHCFDYTHIAGNGIAEQRATRFSSAVQGGLGAHYEFSQRFDVSLTSQYMIHLGKHLHAHQKPSGEFHIHEEKSNALEGHLLFTLSFNYKIGNLWKK